MSVSLKIDLHIHTTVSDGTDTPEEIVARVREEGINVFSVTDHDAVKACGIIPALVGEGQTYVTGAEFSTRDGDGKYHVLGYGFDPDSAPIRELTEAGHRNRMKKVRARLEFLESEFGFAFPSEEIRDLLALDNPGKPHIANLMVKLGYAKDKKQAIDEFINRRRFRNEYIRPEYAIERILAGGGVPVLAHPTYGDGDQLILGDEMEERLKKLIGFGLEGVECFYSGFTPRITRDMLAFAVRFGLYVTAGSDYHGTNKMVPLGDTGLDLADEMPEGLTRFLERVGVVA